MGWWSRPDVIALQVFQYLPQQRTFQQTWNKIQNHYDTTHTCLFHIQTQTQSWLTQTNTHSPPRSAPHSKKASTDLKQCLKWKTAERDIKRRGSLCRKWELSHLAVTERCRMISASLDKKYHLLSSAAYSSLDTGMRPVCQISNLNIYLKGLTKLHLSPACSLNMTGKTEREIKWCSGVTMKLRNAIYIRDTIVMKTWTSGVNLSGKINKSS